ncbi:MAG: methyltransferase domain-containing protein [Candidatus Woesearchaeota archaeon]
MNDAIKKLLDNYESPYKFKRLIMDEYGIPLSICQYSEFLQYLRKIQKKREKLLMLEIGAYVGLFIDFINKNFKNITIKGIDNYEPFTELAKSKKLNVLLGDALELNKLYGSKTFDIIIATNFFHKELKKFKTKESYFNWVDKILDQVLFVLKPKGIFFFDTEIIMDPSQFINKGFNIDSSYLNKECSKKYFALIKKE